MTITLPLFIVFLVSLANAGYLVRQKLTAYDAQAGDQFGKSVAIDGNVAVIGAFESSNEDAKYSGSAYIYSYSNHTWKLSQKLVSEDILSDNRFGRSVAVNNSTIVVGAYQYLRAGYHAGYAYVFTNNGTGWAQQQRLEEPDTTGTNTDFFGTSVAINGDFIFVGASQKNQVRGATYVYKKVEGLSEPWIRKQTLVASDASVQALFGCSIAIHGNLAVIGAYMDRDQGAAYVFQYDDTTDKWEQISKLIPLEPQVRFGYSVAIQDNVIIVGAPGDVNADNKDYGSVYVFKYSPAEDKWQLLLNLYAFDRYSTDYGVRFGESVAIDGKNIVVGSYETPGSAYIFTNDHDQWVPVARWVSAYPSLTDKFGNSVAISKNHVIIGAHLDAGTPVSRSAGSAFAGFTSCDYTGYLAPNCDNKVTVPPAPQSTPNEPQDSETQPSSAPEFLPDQPEYFPEPQAPSLTDKILELGSSYGWIAAPVIIGLILIIGLTVWLCKRNRNKGTSLASREAGQAKHPLKPISESSDSSDPPSQSDSDHEY